MSAGLVRGAAAPVLEPVEARLVLPAAAVLVAGSSDGPAAGELAARFVRALVGLGRAPDALVVSVRAREGAEVGSDDATIEASEPARLLRGAGSVRVHWLRVHPASAERALRALSATLEPGRPLVVVGALALAVVAPRLSVLLTASSPARPDSQARAVERLFTVSLPDASDTLVVGLARLLVS